MTRPILWTSEEILAATDGELRGHAFAASGVSIDTRSLKPGDLFIALIGDHSDGHRYLAQARAAGAVAAIVIEPPKDAPADLPLILVHQTQLALEDLGRAARRRSEARVIGITGSVGKTSAKEMLKLALTPYGQTYATSGNLNNHLGLPLTLANMPRETEYAILEMGMNHAGEIDFLSRMGQPEIAIITTVEAVHLEFFDSIEGIARAKSEIFVGMAAGDKAILLADNPYFPLMQAQAAAHHLQITTFGVTQEADFKVMACQEHMAGMQVTYQHRGQPRHFLLGCFGQHWAQVALSVLAAVEALDLPLEAAETAFSDYTEQAGRGAMLELAWEGGSLTLMDDAYNASPVSMKAAIEKLGRLKPSKEGRRIAILGEMKELGAESPAFHAALAPLLEAAQVEKVFLTGLLMQHLQEALPESLRGGYAADAADLMPCLRDQLRAGDVVLCKGSHGSRVYEIVAALKAGSPLL
jgi:UDP-N-acetylmuramoyl-tripeptide--D-alanyl-D-alanine ligase